MRQVCVRADASGMAMQQFYSGAYQPAEAHPRSFSPGDVTMEIGNHPRGILFGNWTGARPAGAPGATSMPSALVALVRVVSRQTHRSRSCESGHQGLPRNAPDYFRCDGERPRPDSFADRPEPAGGTRLPRTVPTHHSSGGVAREPRFVIADRGETWRDRRRRAGYSARSSGLRSHGHQRTSSRLTTSYLDGANPIRFTRTTAAIATALLPT